MTLRSLAILSALGTAVSLIIAYLLLRFGVFLPYAERQVLNAQNQELARVYTNIEKWHQQLEQQNREWVLSGISLDRHRVLQSSLVDEIYAYDNSLVLRWHSGSTDLKDNLLSQIEGYLRAPLMPIVHPQQPRWRSGWLRLDNELYGYSAGSICRDKLSQCNSGFLLLLRRFDVRDLTALGTEVGLLLGMTAASSSDQDLPALPYNASDIEKRRQVALKGHRGQNVAVIHVEHQSVPPDRYNRTEWLVLLISLVPALIIYLILYRLVARPVERGVTTLRAMERQQQHRAVASPSMLHEFQQLARIFNSLLRRLSQQEEKLQSMARRDALTGLANAQAMKLFIAQEWRRCSRYQRGLALILIEIKPIADLNEASSSEEAAVVLARVLRGFSRRGGEQAGRDSNGLFSLVVAEVDDEQLERLLHRLSQRAAELSPFDKEPATLQMSIGASLVPAGVDVSQLRLSQADWQEYAYNALFQASQTNVGYWHVWSASKLDAPKPTSSKLEVKQSPSGESKLQSNSKAKPKLD